MGILSGTPTNSDLEQDRQEEAKKLEESIRVFNEESLKPDKDFQRLEDLATSAAVCAHVAIGPLLITGQYKRALEMALKAEYFIKQAMTACEIREGQQELKEESHES